MRAFFGSVLMALIAFLLIPTPARAEVTTMMIEEARKAKEAKESFHLSFLPRSRQTVHPIWGPNKLDDVWGQDLLDAFLAQSARNAFWIHISDADDELFTVYRRLSAFVMVGYTLEEDSAGFLGRRRSIWIEKSHLDLLRFKALVREMPDGAPSDVVADVQKNGRMENALRGAKAALNDLRYGFISMPPGNPLQYTYEEECRFSPESSYHHEAHIPFRSLTFEERAICETITARRRRQCIESRAIVTRKRGMDASRWDGYSAAFICGPAIWYFDPDSRPEKSVAQVWQDFPAPARTGGLIARRNLMKFLTEEYERQLSSYDHSCGWDLFR